MSILNNNNNVQPTANPVVSVDGAPMPAAPAAAPAPAYVPATEEAKALYDGIKGQVDGLGHVVCTLHGQTMDKLGALQGSFEELKESQSFWTAGNLLIEGGKVVVIAGVTVLITMAANSIGSDDGLSE